MITLGLDTTGPWCTAALVDDAHVLSQKSEHIGRGHAERLARGLACVCNLLDPEVIVLGGGLSNMPHLYTDLPDLMEPYVFSDHVSTKIVPPKHGDASGVRGAAWLW